MSDQNLASNIAVKVIPTETIKKTKHLVVSQQDINETIDGFQPPELPESFNNFFVTYFNLNPKDLRTYLKFDNQMLDILSLKTVRCVIKKMMLDLYPTRSKTYKGRSFHLCYKEINVEQARYFNCIIM